MAKALLHHWSGRPSRILIPDGMRHQDLECLAKAVGSRRAVGLQGNEPLNMIPGQRGHTPVAMLAPETLHVIAVGAPGNRREN